MAPTYKPLGAPASISGPPPVFDTKAISFEDYDKAQAAQRALELANQHNEIAVGAAQRQADEAARMRQELEAQYGQANPADPNSFDPTAGLRTAQRIYAQQGNVDGMLQVERVLKERGIGNEPLTPEQSQFLENLTGVKIPPGITKSDVTLGAGLQRSTTYNRSINEQIDKRSDMDASLAPGGWTINEDPTTGQKPNKDDGKKFTVAVNSHRMLNSYLDQLDASLATAGSNDPSSPEFVKQRQLIASMQVAMKKKNEFGAALTANEQLINDNILPVILARNDVGVGRAMVEAGFGRDPREAIKNLRQILNEELQSQAATYKFRPATDNGGSSTPTPTPTGAPQPYAPPGRQVLGVDPATGLAIVRK